MEQKLFGSPKDDTVFYQKASFLSRLGSGSAARSVYGGFVVWGKQKGLHGSSDELAIKLNTSVAPEFNNLRDAILITSAQSKSVSSSTGHKLMADHPFAAARYLQARTNLDKLIVALNTGDEQAFNSITENEALSLHAMMMTSADGFTLLNENTWRIINRIRQFRDEKKIFITFTLDAGPNVHLIYREQDKVQVIRFIQEDLLQFCERNNWIDDQAGDGPIKLS
jgi:diphosphomevalonate decarboxylase